MEKQFDVSEVVSLALQKKGYQILIEKQFTNQLQSEKFARDLRYIELQAALHKHALSSNESAAAKPILLNYLELAYFKLEKEHLEKSQAACSQKIESLTNALQGNPNLPHY